MFCEGDDEMHQLKYHCHLLLFIQIMAKLFFVVLVPHHLMGLKGAAWDKVLFPWLEGVANDSDSHTAGRTQQSLLSRMTVLLHPDI